MIPIYYLIQQLILLLLTSSTLTAVGSPGLVSHRRVIGEAMSHNRTTKAERAAMLTQIQRPGVLVNPVFARRLIADIEEREEVATRGSSVYVALTI